MLGSGVAMLQTPVLDGLSFDPFPFQQDGLAAPEVDIGGREVIQALVVAPALAGLQELLGPAVIKALGDTLTPAQLGNAALTAQTIQRKLPRQVDTL